MALVMPWHRTSSGTGDTGPAGVRHVEPPGGAKVSTAMDMLVSGVASVCDLGADCRNGCFSSRAALGRSFGFLHAHMREAAQRRRRVGVVKHESCSSKSGLTIADRKRAASGCQIGIEWYFDKYH